MNQLLVFIIGVILGGVGVWFWVGRKATTSKLKKFNEERAEERNANKQKILDLLVGKGKITNDEIQKLLSISDATATRYLDELEKDGKIKQVGQIGHYVYYEKVG